MSGSVDDTTDAVRAVGSIRFVASLLDGISKSKITMIYKNEIQPLGEWFQAIQQAGACDNLEVHREELPQLPGRLVL